MLRALSEEEEQKSQKMKEKMDKLTDEIMTLREAISSTEEVMSADDRAFLKVAIQIYIILKETSYSCDYIFRYYLHAYQRSLRKTEAAHFLKTLILLLQNYKKTSER